MKIIPLSKTLPNDVRCVVANMCQMTSKELVLHHLHTHQTTMGTSLIQFIWDPTMPITKSLCRIDPEKSCFLFVCPVLCKIACQHGKTGGGIECVHFKAISFKSSVLVKIYLILWSTPEKESSPTTTTVSGWRITHQVSKKRSYWIRF